MPKVSQLQEAFNGGEFAPMSLGRVSSEKYKTGLATCLNYVPTLQGPLLRRPGTKFVKIVSSPAPVIIPFIYSQTQAYMLEFGQQYINFYANNGQVIYNSSIFQISGFNNSLIMPFFATRPQYYPKNGESFVGSSVVLPGQLSIPTPYNQADVANIKYAQSADTLYLTHPNYPTFKLQRFGTYDWRLQQVYFQDGPYLATNSYRQTGDSTYITLQPGGTGWSGLAGALTTIQTGPHTVVTGAAAGTGNQIEITTSSPNAYLNGQNVVIKNVTGTVEANTYTLSTTTQPKYWTIQYIDSTHFLLLGSQFTNNYISGGDIYPALFTDATCVNRPVGLQQGVIANAGQRVWGTITSWLGDDSTVGFQLDASNNLFNTSVVIYWQMGCYGGQINNAGTFLAAGYLGSSSFPSAACFHQNRLCLSGSPNFPQQIDGSQISNFESFSPSVAIGSTSLQVQTNNAFQFTLNSTEVNSLQWMKSTSQGLVSASYSNEWCITPSSQATALSPTNVNAQQTSFFGAANVDAVTAGNAVLYVQRAQRKLREMNYFFQVGTYRSTDLTEVSEHITLPTITKLAVQKETQPLVWAVRSDGNLVSMTYNRDDQSIQAGWARHALGGRSDVNGTNPIVSSIATIPDPSGLYDQLWMIVQRHMLNGNFVYALEYMTNFFNDATLQEDAFQGDCGVTYDTPITITNIVQSSVFTIITAPAHGFSNGNQVRIVGVDGLNQSFTDVNGNVTVVNAVNENAFVVASSSVNAFYLQDYYSHFINTGSSSVYISGGQARLMATSFSGAWWLTGETLSVLADGANHPNVLVGSGGTFTLTYPAAKVQLGYSFNSQGQLLRPSSGSAQGSSIGSTRRVHRAAAMIHNVGDWAWGLSFTDLISWNFTDVDTQSADTATPLFTGIIRDGMEAPYDFEGQLCFQQNSMLPGVVQAITVFMEEFDV